MTIEENIIEYIKDNSEACKSEMYDWFDDVYTEEQISECIDKLLESGKLQTVTVYWVT